MLRTKVVCVGPDDMADARRGPTPVSLEIRMRSIPKVLAASALLLVASCPGCPESCEFESLFGIETELSSCPDSYQLELRLMTGGSQSSLAGAELPEPIHLKVVTDWQNLPRVGVSGVDVRVEVVEGDGTVGGSGAQVLTTDFGGDVEVVWQTGRTPGANQLRATIVSTAIGRGSNAIPIVRRRGSPLDVSATGLARPITGLTVAGGDDQVAAAGAAVTTPPSVSVSDALGPAAGAVVTFAVDLGAGSVTGESVTADANGVAAVGSWVLGTVAGPNRLRADAGGMTVHIGATGTAGAPVTMQKVGGDGQTVAANGAGLVTLPIAPRVRLADQFDNPVAGLVVRFAIGAGAGGVSNPLQTTDAAGEAAPSFWQVGSQAGQYSMTATATAIGGGTIAGNPAAFTATVLASHGPPIAMTAVAGGGQSVGVGQAVPILPAVRVTDDEGRPVPGVTISFAAGNASGAIAGAAPVTDGNGVATVGGWTLGTTAGTQYVISTPPAGSGISPSNLAIQVTALPGAPATLVKIAGDNQTGVTNTPVFTRPTVMVRDQHGNGVPGVSVLFAETSGGGSVTGATQITDAQGRASVGSWSLGSTPGPNTLAATVPPPVGNTMATSSVSFAAQAVLDLRGVARPGAGRSP